MSPGPTKTEKPSEARGSDFRAAADRVRRRLFFCRWLAGLGRSVSVFFLFALVALVAARLVGSPFASWEGAVLLIVSWAGGALLWASLRRPSGFAALAFWDERAGRKEEFASAYFFEKKPRLEESEELHWRANRERLKRESSALKGDIPLPRLGLRWALPLMLVAFAISPFLEPSLEAGDAPLTEEMIEAAKTEAERLAKAKDDFEKMESLSEEEKEEIEKLRQEIAAAADELKRSGGKSVREVLRELEKRARAAEELAERIGGAGDEWASKEMLRAMGEQADTADLAKPIVDKEAGKTADEADRVAERLREPDLSNEARDRIETALSRVMKAAQPEDHKRPVGRDVGAATEDMEEGKPVMAAKDFKRLAEHFRRIEEREKAQEKLRKLAEELRKSGSNVAGKNLESMKQLAGGVGNTMKGMKSMKGMTSPNGQSLTPMNGQNMPSLGQGQPMPMPGLQSGQKGKGKPMSFAPVPGGAKGKPMAIVPGKGQGKPKGMIMAPIPGTAGGQGILMPGGGGLQAGAGSAPMEKSPTGAIEAERNGLVGAQVNEDGESSFREVAGAERTESSERERREQIIDFIRVEEEAIDEKTLPLSRKDHVLRYFTALRERFEDE